MALRVLLSVVGGLLSLAARTSAGFRAAITRDLVFEISTKDGVARTFTFRERGVESRSGRAAAPDCVIRFATASQALATFVSRRTVSKLYAGWLDGTVELEGDPFRILWFYELIQRVVPLAERVAWATPPGAYVVPSTTAAWTKRVVREPAAAVLDPAWTGAVRQRAELKMMRVAAGEPALEF